jgi:hypothetical protein
MPGWRVWLRCIGQAVCAKGPKALLGLVPFGDVLWDVAEDACNRLRGRALAFGEAVLAGAAVEQAMLLVSAIACADGQAALAASAVEGTGRALAAEALFRKFLGRRDPTPPGAV